MSDIKNPHDSPTGQSINARPGRSVGTTWFRMLSRYQWFVLFVAALGWLFDTMDQQLFALARTPAMIELLSETNEVDGQKVVVPPSRDNVAWYGGICTSIFMVGWAVGGLIFGVLGDRLGRAKVMMWTIIVYSLFTGLSSFSQNIWDFALFRFLTGLGVGGEFAVGVALVAEVMPALARPYALGFLQSTSTIGNVMAALISMTLGYAASFGAFENLHVGGQHLTIWRIMFLVGALPALVVLIIRGRLKEPDSWQAARNAARVGNKKLGSYAELFSHPVWRRNAIVGFVLGATGVVGLWGIGFFSFDLINGVATARFTELGYTGQDLQSRVIFWVGITSILQNIGGFFGMNAFSYVSAYTGRKWAFVFSLILAAGSTMLAFSQLDQLGEIFWMAPLMGFGLLSLFGGYAIYFPELFPTHLRSTGTSFCYNVGRFVAALGPLLLGGLTKYVFNEANGFQQGFRWAAVSMCSVFIFGFIALIFAPETRDQPLPE